MKNTFYIIASVLSWITLLTLWGKRVPYVAKYINPIYNKLKSKPLYLFLFGMLSAHLISKAWSGQTTVGWNNQRITGLLQDIWDRLSFKTY